MLMHLISFTIAKSRVAVASRKSQIRAAVTRRLVLFQENVSKLQSETDWDESKNQIYPAHRHRPG